MANHHYVPRFYLRHFACDSGESRVFSMNQNNEIHENKISKICAKENYNTPQQEQAQSALETKHSKILQDFIDTPNPETFNQSHDFVESVSFMMGNNIYIREIIAKLLREILLRTQGSGFDGDISGISIDIGYRGQLESSIGFADCVFEEFQSWKFVRLKVDGNDKVFITSDNPVSMFNTQNAFDPWETSIRLKDVHINFGDESIPTSDGGVSSKCNINFTYDSVSFGQDVVMIFPVNPGVYLIAFSDSSTHARYIEEPKNNIRLACFLNLITLSQCNKAVYSHRKLRLEETNKNRHSFLDYCVRSRLTPSFWVGIRADGVLIGR